MKAVLGRVLYFVLGALVASFFLTQPAHAGLFSSVMTNDWPTTTTKKYKLDMYGFDARAYEFDTTNGMKCVAVYSGGEQKGFQMQCIKGE